MNKLKILIVEDELVIAEDMRMMLEQLGYEVVGVAMDYDEGVEMLRDEQPEIVLSDISLGGDKDGIDLAEIVKGTYNLPLIFITSYSDSSTLGRAKTVKPNGYLVKPFEAKDLYTSIEIAMVNFSGTEGSMEEQGILVNESVYVKDGHALVKIQLDQLKWVKSEGNYIELHMSDRRLVIRSALSEFVSKLPSDKFIRVHKSHAVNLTKVDGLEGHVLTIGEDEIPIGRSYKEDILRSLDPI